MSQQLIVEMIVVGVGLVLISLLVSYISDAIQGKPIVFVPPHFSGMVIGTFISGALFHLICELTGINQWYVNQYKPLL